MIKNIKNNSGFVNLMIFGAVGVLVVGLLITSVFIYRSRVAPPESIFTDMVRATEDIKSFSYSGEFRIETENPETEEPDTAADMFFPTSLFSNSVIAGDFEGAVDFSNEEDPKHFTDINMSLVSQMEGTRVEFFAEGQIRGNKDNLYVRLSELPDIIPFFSLAGLKDQWIELEFVDHERKNIITEREAFIEAIEKYPPFTLERAASERVSGVRTTKYLVEISEENVIRFNREFKEAIGEEVTEEETQTLLASFQALERFEGYIWIGRGDDLPHRISLTTSSRSSMGGLTNTYIDITFSGFNTPKSIEIPEEGKTLEEILQEALGGFLPDAFSSEQGSADIFEDPNFDSTDFPFEL